VQIRIDEIIIRKRVRQDLGDLDQLQQSMRAHGQLNPIVVTPKFELVAGHRRVESAKQIGWRMIEAIVVNDLDDIARLEVEIDENLHRKSLTDDELADGFQKLARLRHPLFPVRAWRSMVGTTRKAWRRIFSRRKKRKNG